MEAAHVPNILKREKPSAQADWLKWIAIAGMFALSYVVFYAIALRGGSDLSIHATWAAEGDFLHPRTFLHHGAHPLWHGLVALVMLTGIPVKVSAALVTAILKAMELWLMHRLLSAYLNERVRPAFITLAAVCSAMVTSLWIPWVNPTVYVGIGSPNTWHSPTQMAAMVMMLLCVPYTAHCYAEFERLLPVHGPQTRLPWKKAVTLGALLLISLLAKPTFMQAFLPAAGLFFLVQWIRHSQNSRFFWQIILVVLPAVLFMIVQYLYYFGIIVPWQGSMALELSWEKLGQVALSTVLIQAFPIFVMAACTRRADWKNPLFALTALLDGIGILEYLILGETGRRAADGNFGWGMMGGALMLWVVALICFINNCLAIQKNHGKSVSKDTPPHDDQRLARGKALVGAALLAWHFGSGIYYIVYLLTTTNPL